ncbi:3-oxoacyl-ACP reductase OS=Streptomyces griseorubiginosus OX=67304 GN=AQJ54_39880 PE=4 SV=1 [Streptomyces griseorubiginosus]
MDLGISGKTALVLGGGGGLGSAIAQALAAEGAGVAVADISAEAAERTVEAVAHLGGKAVSLEWDLGDLGAVDRHITTIERVLGPVDILVNNTGGPPPSLVGGQDPEIWLRHFQSMVLSVIAITDRVAPLMRRHGWAGSSPAPVPA